MSNQEIRASISAANELGSLQNEILKFLKKNPKTIVILDDDPTGTQTVYDIPVITDWTQKAIEAEMQNSPIFFILTNSRSLHAEEANALGVIIGERLQKAAKTLEKKLIIISRSDSTLRGHYPNEVDALVKGLGWTDTKHILAPAFFEGGRYTYKDVHYVKEGEDFIPAAETPFAKDNSFGYKASNLKEWIVEKSNGEIPRNAITCFDIDSLQRKSKKDLLSLLQKSDFSHFLSNATSLYHLQVLALTCLEFDGNLVFRAAASFVNAISGIPVSNILKKEQVIKNRSENGGLIVVGSYVQKTTAQLDFLKKESDCHFMELDVSQVLYPIKFEKALLVLTENIDRQIASGKTTVLYTSRLVVKGSDKAESLEIVNRVSKGIIDLIRQLKNRPKYILAKGGITSSDIATKGLGVKRAMVLGQILKGVPVWQLGSETKFPDLPYIVFPGNVGDEKALHKVIEKLT